MQNKPSIFSIMSQLAQQHQAINLAQGFPDFDIDPGLELLIAEKSRQKFHQYMPFSGYMPLLEQLAQRCLEHYGRNTNPATEILITAGATQGIFTAIQALVKAGEEVLILDPAYDCYDLPVKLLGAKAVHLPLNADYTPDWNRIKDAVNDKTRLIVINNPHNPSGKIWQETDFLALEDLVARHPNLLVLADEVYEYISFEPHISVNTRPQLRERCIAVSSFGKTLHITGWKVGYLVAEKNLMDPIKQVHQYLVFSVNSLAQAVLSDYLHTADFTQPARLYAQKRALFRSAMQPSRFELLPCDGTYFQCASYAGISLDDDLTFTRNLVADTGVAAIPLSVFHADGTDRRHLRFCFAKTDQTLLAAAEKLCRL